jgi:hypothetical protein
MAKVRHPTKQKNAEAPLLSVKQNTLLPVNLGSLLRNRTTHKQNRKYQRKLTAPNTEKTDLMKPLAVRIVAGMITSPIHPVRLAVLRDNEALRSRLRRGSRYLRLLLTSSPR